MARITRAEHNRRLARVEAAGDLRDILMDIRDKATSNATSGSQDERDAWTGIASEISRALHLSTKL